MDLEKIDSISTSGAVFRFLHRTARLLYIIANQSWDNTDIININTREMRDIIRGYLVSLVGTTPSYIKGTTRPLSTYVGM